MNENQQVIMVLSKKSIHKPISLEQDYEIKSNDDLEYTITRNKEEAAHGLLKTGDAFNDSRLFIQGLKISDTQNFDSLVPALVSRLVLLNESKPSKYPNYVLVDAEDISLIKALARMGFTPYLGPWKNADEEESEKIWEVITQQLRESN